MKKMFLLLSIKKVIKLLMVVILLIILPLLAFADDPYCAGINRWPTMSALAKLIKEGITDNNKLNFLKTKTVRLASEKIGNNLYRQIHYVTFTEKSGNTIQVITVNDASNEECSMSNVDVFVISRYLGHEILLKDKPVK